MSEHEDDVYYVMSTGAILHEVVKDWNLTAEWNPKIYEAAFNDMMEMLVKAGHIGRVSND